jgi:hypothetical protein
MKYPSAKTAAAIHTIQNAVISAKSWADFNLLVFMPVQPVNVTLRGTRLRRFNRFSRIGEMILLDNQSLGDGK